MSLLKAPSAPQDLEVLLNLFRQQYSHMDRGPWSQAERIILNLLTNDFNPEDTSDTFKIRSNQPGPAAARSSYNVT